MIDITSVTEGDIRFFDTQTTRAQNILSVQLGALEYEPEMGIDLAYFLQEEFSFQNESFKSYLIQRLANYSINVASVVEQVEDLFNKYTFNLTPAETGTSLIAR
jgi:hypothetical protein